MTLWRRSFQTRRARIVARVLFYSAAVVIGLPLAFSQVMISPVRQAAASPPSDYEEARVKSGDLRLRTWTLRGRPERAAVIVTHGVGDSLESFTDVGRMLNRRGHTALLVDLRGHGASEGRYMTLGAHERDDVRAAMRHLREAGLARSGFILMGFSMGTAAVMLAAPDEPETRALIVEAPFDTYRDTVAHHGQLLYGLPRWFPLTPLAVAMAQWRAGFDADDVDLVAAARRTPAALLAIADGADTRMPEAVVRRVYDAHRGPKSLWVAPDAPHVGAIGSAEYWPTLLRFLDANGL